MKKNNFPFFKNFVVVFFIAFFILMVIDLIIKILGFDGVFLISMVIAVIYTFIEYLRKK